MDRITGFTLERHHLWKPAKAGDLVEVVSRICGLNAQSARSPYISLWNRLQGFSREQLDKALYNDRRLIKTWLMRGTVHMVPSDEFIAYQVALRSHLTTYWEGFITRFGDSSLKRLSARLFDSLLSEISRGPRTKKELLPEVEHLLKPYSERQRKIILSCALRQMSYLGFICHAEPTGTWYHFRDNRFTIVLDWLPGGILAKISEEEARSRLLLNYLRGYGPATAQDFAYWSGLRMSQVRQVFGSVEGLIHSVEIDGCRGTYWLRNDDGDAFERSRSRRKIPVRFLPEFDPLIMGHKDKLRIMDEPYKAKVFLRLADVAPVIMFNGRAAGTWNYRFTDNSLTIRMFGRGPADAKTPITHKAKDLTDFLEV
jgi:hypothetical protein